MPQPPPALSRTTSRQRQSHSRPRLGSRRATSTHSVPYLPQGPAALLLPEGDVGEEAAELLHEFVHPHDHANDFVEPEEPSVEQERASYAQRPWWRRPSPWWFLIMVPLSSIAGGAVMAPRIEILTMLACDHHKPEYTAGHGMEDLGIRLPRWAHRGSDSITILDRIAPVVDGGAQPFWAVDGKADGSDAVYFATEVGGNATVPNPALCKTDPVVQRAVTKLTATMSTVQGILAVLTVGWWGALSDRIGRTRVVGITILGILVLDFSFIITALFSKRLPGGYWFLLLGPIVEGCLGGMGAASAAVHAYISDTTEPQARARIFSLNLGMLFVGMAIGPTLGGILRRTTGNALNIFYFATCIHFLYAIINWTILPESLSSARKRAARRRHTQALADARKLYKERHGTGWAAAAKRVPKVMFGFAEPLAILMPVRVNSKAFPGKKARWDSSLTFVAFSYMFVIMVMGSIAYKFQYAQAHFNWTSEELGYWLSSVGAARAVHLTVILPLILKFLKPKPPPIQLPVEPNEPLEGSIAGTPATPSTPAKPPPTYNTMTFDLRLARVSLLLDVTAYILMPLAPSGHVFTLAAMLGSLGSGFGPAMQSIALELHGRRTGGGDVGRLFGSLSVLSGIGASVVGPSLFGVIYSKTVDWFPEAIFFATATSAMISFVLLMFVRLPRDEEGDEEDLVGPVEDDEVPVGAARPGVDREQTLVDTGAVDGAVAPQGKAVVPIQE